MTTYTEPINRTAAAAAIAVIDADIQHNRFNGYREHQLAKATEQVTYLKAHIADLLVYIASLEALTP